MIKLNIGCGSDYREGFINIDGSSSLPRVDKVLDISKGISGEFEEDSVGFILANDVIEHLFHWEASVVLKDFHKILKRNGICEIRVPNCEFIINCDKISLEEKMLLLFGGQDIEQGDNKEMNKSRKEFPNFFCHKYGWTKERMVNELNKSGFLVVVIREEEMNFVAIAMK